MRYSNAPRHGSGFTLVEVLVALVVLAVGMLGIAGLYVEGLKAGRTSIYRTTAVRLASDMADRIRANPVAPASYAGAGPGTNEFVCVNGAAPCNADELAQDDWFSWNQAVQARLPQGAAANIAVQPVGTLTQYTITLQWPEVGQADPVSYTLVMQQ
jgi:type IV pilus assembly protein PilV